MLNKIYAEAASKKIKSPLGYKHVKMVRMVLLLLGFWPIKECEKKEDRFCKLFLYNNVFWTTLCSPLIIGYLVVHYKEHSFIEVGQMCLTSCLNVVTVVRCVIPFDPRYKKFVGLFIRKVHLLHHRGSSEFAMQIHKRVHSYCHVYTVYLFTLMLFGPSTNAMSFVYSNYSQGKLDEPYLYNATYEYITYFLYPAGAMNNRETYIYMTIFNLYMSYLCCCNIVMVDLYVIIIVFHVWGHFKVLGNNLITFPRPAATSENAQSSDIMFTEEELKDVSKKLKQCINYHRFLTSFTDNMSNALGLMLLSYYLFHQITCCLLLLQVSQMTMEALIRYGVLTGVMFQQLVQIYVIFEMIETASEAITDAIYSVPWECMDVANRKTVLIYMMISQKPVHVKALGIVDIGVKSMVFVLKTSISYFTFLRTIPD